MNDSTQSPQNEQPFESALAAMFAQLSGDPHTKIDGSRIMVERTEADRE